MEPSGMRTTFRLMNLRKIQRGMTMVELLTTITILAILLGIGVPSMARFIADWRVSNAVNAVSGSLRMARTEAIARARPVVICRVDGDTSTTCLSTAGTHGFASGWIMFVNNDGDANYNYSADNGDELLLRQPTIKGIADITPTRAGRFIFLPNGLLNSNNTGLNIDADGYSSSKPWTRKGMCISKPGRIRYVADSVDCSDAEST